MKQQCAHPGFYQCVGHSQWRALGRVVFFALLLTQQAWAGLFCCCEPAPTSPPGAAKSAHPACHAAVEEAALSNKVDDKVDDKAQPLPPPVAMCCAMPPVEAERVTLLTPNQTFIPNTLLPLVGNLPLSPTTILRSTVPAPLQRPLYLALSCWLI